MVAALCEGLRRRAGRLGDCGGASIMVASEELLLLEAERDLGGVEVREVIFCKSRRAAVCFSIPCGASMQCACDAMYNRGRSHSTKGIAQCPRAAGDTKTAVKQAQAEVVHSPSGQRK